MMLSPTIISIAVLVGVIAAVAAVFTMFTESSGSPPASTDAANRSPGLEYCRACGHVVHFDARTCPDCGVPDPSTRKHREKSQAELVGILGAAGFVGFLFFACVLRSGPDSSTSQGSSDYSDKIGAMTTAQEIIKRELKSPSTADFPWSIDEYVITNLGGNRWTVSGYVDAQNGFGAMIRSDWNVTFAERESGSKTHVAVESLSIH